MKILKFHINIVALVISFTRKLQHRNFGT